MIHFPVLPIIPKTIRRRSTSAGGGDAGGAEIKLAVVGRAAVPGDGAVMDGAAGTFIEIPLRDRLAAVKIPGDLRRRTGVVIDLHVIDQA